MRRRPLRRGPFPQEPSALPAPSPAPCWPHQIARLNVGALQGVVGPMATFLGVSPGRILLLFGETELSTPPPPGPCSLERLHHWLRGAGERPRAAEASQAPAAPAAGGEARGAARLAVPGFSPKTLMSHYAEAMGLSRRKLSFFGGTQLSGKDLPADLGMESGDLIEIWG